MRTLAKGWLVWLLLGLGASTATAQQDLLFYLPFEGTTQAQVAKGEGKPEIEKDISYVPGIKGQGALFEKASSLAYREAGNINKAEGSIEFWMKPKWRGDDNTWRAFFLEDGPYEEGANTIRFWKPGDMGLRFDPCCTEQIWLRAPTWQPDEWHHLLATWNHRREMTLYVDGRLKAKLPFAWPIRDHKVMYVGCANPQHRDEWNVIAAEAVIDEFRIYGRALNEEEVKGRYGEIIPIAIKLPLIPVRAGEPTTIQAQVMNLSDAELSGKLYYKLTDPQEKIIAQESDPNWRLKGKRTYSLPIRFRPQMGGEHTLTCIWQGKEQRVTQKARMMVLNPRGPASLQPSLKLKLIQEINCVAEDRPEWYRDDGKARVVDSPLGRYREAGDERNSRFAYRFQVKNLHVPHLLVVEYPDDKERTMAIDGNSPHHEVTWDIATGVLCGGEFPNTDRFHEHKIIFWPREEDNLVTLMTWAKGKPAAARTIKVYEIEGGLPALKINEPQGEPTRLIGHQWEDASLYICYGSMAQGDFVELTRAIGNMIDYFRWTGQNLFMYPIFMYSSLIYPSAVESWGGGRSVGHDVAADQDWIALALEMFGKEGIYFIPSLTMLDLPSLRQQQMTDVDKVKAGTDTINMVLANDGVRRSCDIHGGGEGGDPQRRSRNQAGPVYNPLHPKVQQAALAVIQEMIDRYGDYPAFKGLSINFWGENLLWFGTIQSGYGDLEIGMFEKDTGVKIPIDANDPQRFSKRYQWLMDNARDKWLHWRCGQIHQLMIKIRDMLVKKRSDLKLVLASWVPYPTSWSPTPEKTYGGTLDISQWVPGERGLYEITREGGLDFKLYRGKRNIVIERQQYPSDYRWREAHSGWSPEIQLSRDINFDPEVASAVTNAPNTYVWFYNRYFENAIGREKPLPDLWWQECPWRGSAVVPANKYFMENYAFSLAALDATGITDGGTTNGTIGHDQQIQQFAQAYRALPAQEFSQVSGASDPVVVRYLKTPKRYYFYLVNREYYPANVQLEFSAQGITVTNLADGRQTKVEGQTMTVRLSPYELRSYGANPKTSIKKATTIVPPEIVQDLEGRAAAIKAKIVSAEAQGQQVEDAKRVLGEIEKALAEKRYSAAHYLSESFWVKKLPKTTK